MLHTILGLVSTAVAGPPPAWSLADAAAQAIPASVHLHVQKSRRWAPELHEVRQAYGLPAAPGSAASRATREATGSGVIVSADGRVYTNHHVVEGAVRLEAMFADQRRVTARVVATDPRSDLALVQLEGVGPYATMEPGDPATLRVGDFVLAVGNPFDFTASATAGILSARSRRGLAAGEIQDYLQTDASINPGNSGGALVDASGRLIGINTAIYAPAAQQSAGVSFAIPIPMADGVATELLEFGYVRRPWIGVHVATAPIAEGDPSRGGVEIMRIFPGSPAEAAALRRGDVVVAIDEVPTPTIESFRSALLARRVTVARRLQVLRDDAAFTVVLQPTTREEQRLPEVEPHRAHPAGAMRLADVDAPLAAALGLPVGGAAVTGMTEGALGARLGDRIEGIAGVPVTTVAAAHRALERCERWCIADFKRENAAIRVIWDARPDQSSGR